MYKDSIKKTATALNLPEEFVDKVYRSFWIFVRASIKELNLKRELTEEEFNSLRTNFNIPSLGKLCCTYKDYCSVKQRLKYISELKNINTNEYKED